VPGYLLAKPPRRGGRAGKGVIMPSEIGRDEVRELAGQRAQLVEVPAGDYAWTHLPGAVNHPLKELDARTGQLDRSRPVIVYCHDCY
jgi:rhodanese-related sulfurtransferase